MKYCVLVGVFTVLMGLSVQAATVPLVLPRPDGKPGDMTKPVKVYILAGQSNMLGFGYLSGSKPAYRSVLLSADPNIIAEPLMGRKLIAHGIYQAAAGDERGAKVAFYSGAYDPAVDYGEKTAAKEATAPLGTVSATLPSVDGPHTIVAKAFIDVPATGLYSLHAGYKDSTYAIVKLDGKEVYRKTVPATGSATTMAPVIEKVTLEAGRRYPITITYMKGGSCAFWMEQTGLKGKGDLTTLTKEGKFPWFVDEQGNWTVRNDVIYREVRCSGGELGRGGPLSATSNGRYIGPEVAFGFVMGTFHEEQVLLIESSMGNRALSFDFRPPSSGRPNPENSFESLEYQLMVEGVHKTLKNLDKVVPDYKGQGYDLAGFAWFQGHKDRTNTKEEYEKDLVNLIQDLRKEFKAPKMRAVIATVAFDGWRPDGGYAHIHSAQMAVGDAKQHPEFSGTVASVDTRGFIRSREESPTGAGYHYNHNAETYVLTGDALGRAMVELLGGKVEKPAAPVPPEPVPEKPAPTEAQRAAHTQVIAPIVLDGLLEEYLSNPRTKSSVVNAFNGKRGAAPGARGSSQFAEDVIDSLNNYYTTVGIDDYNWHDFAPDLKDGTWEYFSFDPPEVKKDRSSGASYRKITLPAGMTNWYAVDFDAAKAGWKTGAAPFAQSGGRLDAWSSSCDQEVCRCGVPPKTLWEKEVLLLRKTFDAPTLKPGHRYRILLGGACHVAAGDGFELYVNGKLLSKATHQVGKKQGGKPRGSVIYADNIKDFEGGKITIAWKGFLRYNHPKVPKDYPPNGHISIWLQEQKLPPVDASS